MSRIIKYRFHLEAVSPLFFGSNESGMLLRNSKDCPFVTGNSIGGAIKSFLNRYYVKKEKDENILLNSLGGERYLEDESKVEFIESSVTISDGIIEFSKDKIKKKEGTKVNRDTATAENGNKYEFEYLEKGTKISFDMECNEVSIIEKFEEIIQYIVNGFNTRELTLGGHFNNGFGKLKIIKLAKQEFDLNTLEDLEKYIFNRNNEPWIEMDIENNINRYIQPEKVVFKLEGKFPYGVYQNFTTEEDSSLTGVQMNRNNNHYIPASSIKGLMKSEIEKSYNSLDVCGEKYCENLFGGSNSKGKIRFSDIILKEVKEIKIFSGKMGKQKEIIEEYNYPTYNKVDRLTGGAYNNALFKQRDIEGEAIIQFAMDAFDGYKKSIYPILIVLRNIGLGLIPIGGRTAVGLGEFKARKIIVYTKDYELNIKFDDKGLSEIDNKEKLDDLKTIFENSLKKGEV